MTRRGFTLLEVLIGMAVSTMLMGAIYIFYMGMVRTQVKSEERVDLNRHAEVYLEQISRELQLAVEFTKLAPGEISFRRPEISAFVDPRSDQEGYAVNMDLGSRKFETVTYRRHELEGGRVALQRLEGLDAPETLFVVDEMDPLVFTGWVIPRGSEETPHEVPDMQVYRADRDVRSDLERIPLVRIRFRMKLGRDRLNITTKAFVPPVYARIVQPHWNRG